MVTLRDLIAKGCGDERRESTQRDELRQQFRSRISYLAMLFVERERERGARPFIVRTVEFKAQYVERCEKKKSIARPVCARARACGGWARRSTIAKRLEQSARDGELRAAHFTVNKEPASA